MGQSPPPFMIQIPVFGETVIVGHEELPPAGPGEVQVGDGDGPREVTEFREKQMSFPDIRELVDVQPMVRPTGRVLPWLSNLK